MEESSQSSAECPSWIEDITSTAYRISVDNGRETFFALIIEGTNEKSWIGSDTVHSLEKMR